MGKLDHNNNFNLLRFFFASLVIVSHVPELQDGNRSNEILSRIAGTISFGEMAVDSFFVLSGFLIVKSWKDRPSIIAFLASRVLRIYPGFIAASLLCAFVVGPIYGGASYFQDFEPIRFILGLSKLSLMGNPAVFSDTPYPSLNGAMWSISYEFKCYLLVLASGLTGVLNRRRIWLSLFLICTVSHVANRIGMVRIPYDLNFRCGMAFTAGGCFYLYRDVLTWRVDVALVSLLVFMALLFFRPIAEPALCLFWGYAVLFYAQAGKSLLGFNRFPDISYGVYLYAWPINKIVLWHFPSMNVYVAMGLVFIMSLFAGTVSSYVVEMPFMGLKKYFRHSSLQPA